MKELKELDQHLKEAKPPKYVNINGVKIITPKKIVRLDWYEGKCEIYGDPRLQKYAFDEKQLTILNKQRKFLVVLKQTKKRGGAYAFPVPLNYILNQRKWRLSMFITIEKTHEAEGKEDYKTAVDHIKELIPIKEGLTQEEIFDEFQTSMDPALISMDISRIIQLYYEDKDEEPETKVIKLNKKENNDNQKKN